MTVDSTKTDLLLCFFVCYRCSCFVIVFVVFVVFVLCNNKKVWLLVFFIQLFIDRPGVAGAVLQTASLLID